MTSASVMESSRAAVSDGRGTSTVVELTHPPAAGWLRVESSAICGTDVALHGGRLRHPAVLGHHVVGRVVEITDALASRLQVGVGDRVAVEEYLGCNECADCRRGDYRYCSQVDLWGAGERVGMLPVTRGSGLHGGNAQHVELTEHHRVHRLDDSTSRELAAWTLPLANAIDWTVVRGGCGDGSRMAIIGPGYHGLACAVAALTSGASAVTVVGLRSDAERLRYASTVGAQTQVTEDLDPAHLPSELTGLDLVVDTVGTTQTTELALQALGRHGRLVVAGISGERLSLASDRFIRQQIVAVGVRGRDASSVTRSIELLATSPPLSGVPTAWVPLERVGQVLDDLAHGTGPATPHVVIDPWLPDPTPTADHLIQEAVS